MSNTKLLYKNEDNILIEDYILLETIGEGAFGKVKLGIHKPTKQEVAIKIFEKKNLSSPQDLLVFKKEISILKKLNHPNIIKIYNLLEDESNYYIIMEYALKGDLFNYIVSKKKLEEKEASYFYCQLILAIEFLHNLGITHRDLKPENLLIKDNNLLTIIDFGLSGECPNNQLLSTPCGSPSYAAPEMILGKKYNGLNTDIWSSGIILYAMVCGHLPFEDNDQEKLYKNILTLNYDLPNFLSENCKDLIKKILCINEKKRIDINGIKNHPFLIDSFKRYNPYEFIYYNPKKIYNKVIEIMVNNLSEYNYNKNEILYSIKNNIFNNLTTTYELLLKKLSFKENKNDSNFLFTKSSTDSCVTTNNASNLVIKSALPFFDEKKKIKIINKRNVQKQKFNDSNNESKKEIKKLNTDMNKESLSLSIHEKMDNKNKNKIYSYYTQNNELFSTNNKKRVNKQIFERTNYKSNKYEHEVIENNNYDNFDSNISKFKCSNSNEIYSKEGNNEDNNNDPYFLLNSISSREMASYKKEIKHNKTNDKRNKINKISNDFDDNYIPHNQNMYSNDICNFYISEIDENGIDKTNKSNNMKKNDSPVILPQSQNKSKIKQIKKNINYFDNFLLKTCHVNKTELNKSDVSNGYEKFFNSKDEKKFQTSNLKKNKNLYKIKKQKIFGENKGEKNESIFVKDSTIFNNIQISFPKTKRISKHKFLNNFKKKFSNKHSPSPPSIYIKINSEKNKRNVQQLTPQNNFEEVNTIIKSKPKSVYKKLFLNNSSNKKINTENIFTKNDKKENNNNYYKINKRKMKSNPKTYYLINKKKSINDDYDLIKMNKNNINSKRKNSNSLVSNPFNNNSTQNNNIIEKNNINSMLSVYDNNINNNNSNTNFNSSIFTTINNTSNNTININIPVMHSSKIINEKKSVELKTSSGKFLKSEYYAYSNNSYNNKEKKKDKSYSNKNLIMFNNAKINNYNNNLKKINFNTIINNNNSNDSYFSESNTIHNNRNELNNFAKKFSNKKDKKMKSIDLYVNKKKKKNKDKYCKKTYDSTSNDFAVCNTNSTLEEINKKLFDLSREKRFQLIKYNLKNYICTKNKNDSIIIEICSKGKINMLKIYYLEGKENITKELIKSIIFSIGF